MMTPELLAPAGDLVKLRLAYEYGADAVYVGAAGLSMRPDSASMSVEDLQQATEMARGYGKRIYVALNTLLFQDDLAILEKWISRTQQLSFDAIILSDPGAFSLFKKLRADLPIHISTQLSTANACAASFWKEAGASRVILARECTLADATTIARQGAVDVEVFVHGAMCVAISGRCLLSAHLCGNSASKGQCKHSCRWEWQLVEKKRPGQAIPIFEDGKQTILLGSTDLCLIQQIPALVQGRFAGLKIEGRMKSAYHVAAVTRVYRAALDAYASDPEGYRVDPCWIDELDAISHRPYAEGFATGYPAEDPRSLQTFNRPVSRCKVVGYVVDHHEGDFTIEVKNPFVPGETLEWIGPEMVSGKITIATIHDEAGDALQRTISATLVHVTIKQASAGFARHCILRRRS